jgi:hypothetical protein
LFLQFSQQNQGMSSFDPMDEPRLAANSSHTVFNSNASEVPGRLKSLIAEMLEAEQALKAGEETDITQLAELREALDGLRLTAWTIHELLNAREMKVNPRKVLTFMAAERVRRLTTLARDLAHDFSQAGYAPNTEEVRALSEALSYLHARLQVPAP